MNLLTKQQASASLYGTAKTREQKEILLNLDRIETKNLGHTECELVRPHPEAMAKFLDVSPLAVMT